MVDRTFDSPRFRSSLDLWLTGRSTVPDEWEGMSLEEIEKDQERRLYSEKGLEILKKFREQEAPNDSE